MRVLAVLGEGISSVAEYIVAWIDHGFLRVLDDFIMLSQHRQKKCHGIKKSEHEELELHLASELHYDVPLFLSFGFCIAGGVRKSDHHSFGA